MTQFFSSKTIQPNYIDFLFLDTLVKRLFMLCPFKERKVQQSISPSYVRVTPTFTR